MSELIQSNDQPALRRRLLIGTSALVLTAYVSAVAAETPETADRPTVWVELGAQMEQSQTGDVFAPPFVTSNDWTSMHLPSPASVQEMKPFNFGGEGSLAFEPAGTDWVLSASVRYGRSTSKRHSHVQPQAAGRAFLEPAFFTGEGFACCKTYIFTPDVTNYEDTQVTKRKSHLILDFQAGKDVGLGLFGRGSSSVISVGVRLAQFHSKSSVVGHARANWIQYNGIDAGYSYYWPPPASVPASRYHSYAFTGQSDRSFHGIGPSIAWKGSTPFLGNEEQGEVTFDWGVNAAVLFGRQRIKERHQTSGNYHVPKYYNTLGLPYGTQHYEQGAAHTRSRSVVVPNLGGFAGISFKYPNAKVSFGYRADFFFGAMDTGIDARSAKDVGFHGPFATISIGLGG